MRFTALWETQIGEKGRKFGQRWKEEEGVVMLISVSRMAFYSVGLRDKNATNWGFEHQRVTPLHLLFITSR